MYIDRYFTLQKLKPYTNAFSQEAKSRHNLLKNLVHCERLHVCNINKLCLLPPSPLPPLSAHSSPPPGGCRRGTRSIAQTGTEHLALVWVTVMPTLVQEV